ncbi:helix-turn-helix domain-containing protein [Crassaminicella thermophila]|uniref:helix-turn-helix domain-containing protein n=1 Tax=Crassaminicella thermophila TaxID=2599308 RepID=UPI001E517B3D|nr:helix-turn-helix domain-containing protein [Crassaminicella thermophila]
MRGWISLYRCLLEKPIWKNSTPEQKTILITLLLMANHQESEWEWKGQKFKAKPGQFITSLDSIVKACGKGITIQNVRSALKRFEKLGFLTNQSTKTGRLITIENWEIYQENNNQSNKANNKEVTKRQQRGNKEVTPNNNDNNDINNTISKDIVSSTKVQPIIQKWNSLGLQKIISVNPGTNRYKLLNARLKEYGLDNLLKAIDNIKQSSFLKGQNPKGWTITFDWLIKPNNFIKVLEGNYVDKETENNASNTQPQFKKNGFHNFEQRTKKYTKEQLEAMFRENKTS